MSEKFLLSDKMRKPIEMVGHIQQSPIGVPVRSDKM